MDAIAVEMAATTEDADAVQIDAADVEIAETVEAVEMAVGEMEAAVGITAAVRHSAMDSARDLKKVSEMVSRLQMITVDSRSQAEVLAALVGAMAVLAQLREDLVVDAVDVETNLITA